MPFEYDDEVQKLKAHLANREGYQAYLNGLKQSDNPYGLSEDFLFDAWKEGYYQAVDDD